MGNGQLVNLSKVTLLLDKQNININMIIISLSFYFNASILFETC